MTTLQLASPSVATDGAWLAAADVAAISASLGIEYRFVRGDPDERRVIDVLVPSSGGKHQPNQQLGSLVVDAVPGLSLALALPATEVVLAAHLSTGRTVDLSLLLPDVRAALILKSYAYRERLTDRDAVDVWRLLESAENAGLEASDWPPRVSGREAAAYLHQFFGAAGAPGARRASPAPATQARVRLLVQKLVPRPE
ncbi:hypothetical protein AB1046_12825 [Promicromonospora sp. Populi]|uniref:hypothetical protein n=1 Tax=Promicromonospora sp. Populi TaxID=3239420 RepID=UPI0034E2BDB0